MKTKRAVDIVMTLLLLFLMSYQVTEQAAHEWLGMGMTALVILHQILNRKWYAALFRGKYGAIRILCFVAGRFRSVGGQRHGVERIRRPFPSESAPARHGASHALVRVLLGISPHGSAFRTALGGYFGKATP